MYRIKKMGYIRFFVAETNKNDFQKSDTPDKNIRYIPLILWRTSGVTNGVRMQTLTPASRCKKKLLRRVKIPVGSSKKTWDRYDVVWAYPVPFRPRVSVPPVKSKIEKIASTAFPTHAARSCYKTCTNTLIVFLNTAWSDLLLHLRKLTIVAL